jgi:hypothetical protein
MLFARAISNGVKWYCPDVFSGPVYVPEEMPSVTEEVSHVVVDTTIDEIINDIQVCVSLDEIKAVWKKLTLNQKSDLRVLAAKDAMKVKLTPVSTQTPAE